MGAGRAKEDRNKLRTPKPREARPSARLRFAPVMCGANRDQVPKRETPRMRKIIRIAHIPQKDFIFVYLFFLFSPRPQITESSHDSRSPPSDVCWAAAAASLPVGRLERLLTPQTKQKKNKKTKKWT
jgi:hypothetical protein